MLHMIGHIFPGHDPGGIIVTMLLGIAGAWVGGGNRTTRLLRPSPIVASHVAPAREARAGTVRLAA